MDEFRSIDKVTLNAGTADRTISTMLVSVLKPRSARNQPSRRPSTPVPTTFDPVAMFRLLVYS
jgi:hypothetical protein